MLSPVPVHAQVAAGPWQARQWFWLSCGVFGVLGFGSALLGPTLGDLAQTLAITLPLAGSIRSGRQLGQFLASVSCAWLGARLSTALLGLAGFLCYSAGLLLLLLPAGLPVAVLAAVLWGLGQGGLHVVCNAEVVARMGDQAPRHVAQLHFWYSLGSIAGPLLVYLCRLTGHWGAAYALAAGTMAVLGSRLFRHQATPVSELNRAAKPRLPIGLAVLAAPMVAVSAVNMMNAGLADWSYQNAVLVASAGPAAATAVTSAFWISVAVGRLISVRLVDLLGTGPLLVASAAVATVGTGGIVLWGPHIPSLTAATALAGLGIAPLYPLVTALGAAATDSPTTAAGVLSAAAAASAALGPMAQGFLGGGQDGGMVLVAALALPLVIGVVLTVRQDRARKVTLPGAHGAGPGRHPGA
ncbi:MULTISPECIES: sugar MFS transporter [unclassified Crossiella]|uniref:MFS transporter n=1 Tax=unclassified Crossiella TaxID=2620835 RepID=UPI001FFE5F8B|nr:MULTISPECIES: MFS transporter [unclassified Crossiella]MCK2238485.1 MFS transporter [Crossiella sp. S99.2]MCK2251945.1 MFS transporter [Crossiella sp. S99.1]